MRAGGANKSIVNRTLILALGLLVPLCAVGQTKPAPTGGAWSGTLGAGPMLFPKYVGGRDGQIVPLPIAYVDYDGWFYVNLFRAGAYVWGSADKTKGLSFSAEPRLGFKSGDGPRLAGMTTRRDSVAGGPTFDWTGDFGSLSLGYFFDLSHASRGSYADVLFDRPLIKNARWDVSGTLELSRIDANITRYYFGVGRAEVTPARPLYQPGSTTNATLWITGQYKVDQRYALMFGVNASRLGSAAADSPVVERRTAPFAYLGLGIQL